MNRWRNLGALLRSSWLWPTGMAVLLTTFLVLILVAQEAARIPPNASLPPKEPEPIYSNGSSDPWNRIFYFLFSRRIETRVSYEFPEGAPFVDSISTRTFERDEIGDRAIDPLYPSRFVITGSRLILTEPAFSGFRRALQQALDENVPRSPIAKALMQSDLWGAHDILFYPFSPSDEKDLGQRRIVALDLISRLMRKTALTPEEIKSLPNNYSAAMRKYSLPDVFGQGSGWIEVLWFHPRIHDTFARYRRTSRVFLKLAQQSHIQAFLDGLPGRAESDPIAGLEGVALITQLLLIDSRGEVQPTALTSEVQVRLFEKTQRGEFKKTSLQVCEINRKLFMQKQETGGLVQEVESAPTYTGRYSFAEGEPDAETGNSTTLITTPIQSTLRAHCAACHGEDLTQLKTFSIVRPPHPPQVRQLNQAANETASFDIAQKTKEKGFKALRVYFRSAASGATRH